MLKNVINLDEDKIRSLYIVGIVAGVYSCFVGIVVDQTLSYWSEDWCCALLYFAFFAPIIAFMGFCSLKLINMIYPLLKKSYTIFVCGTCLVIVI